jgi:hypothetical protein
MDFDQRWHGSRPLDYIGVGDVLRVKNVDTGEVIEWRVTEPAVTLSPEEARTEWSQFPFGSESVAKRHGYFPYVLKNLVLVGGR